MSSIRWTGGILFAAFAFATLAGVETTFAQSTEGEPELGTPPTTAAPPSATQPAPAAPGPVLAPPVPKPAPAAPKDFEKAATGAYKGLFYENDFSYLDDPQYDGWHLGESFKQLHFADGVVADFGGQYRARYHHEVNMRGLGLTGLSDDFLLHRTRLYGDVHIGDGFRVYGELIDAVSEFERNQPRPIEENRTDILNAFGDALIADSCSGELWARVGRQELLYGSQRVVSPLDWANTRRTFDGAKLFWRGEDWNVDGFWTQPVYPQANVRDEGDASQDFAGVYSSYKGFGKEKTLDFYYLHFSEDNATTEFAYDTFGVYTTGSHEGWLYDAELDYQIARIAGVDSSQFASTVGLGRKTGDAKWSPTVWLYYDYASEFYHHQFPLAHKYLGFMDLYGRRNLHDLNVLATMPATDRLTLLCWYHQFWLADTAQGPFGVTEAPFNAGVPAGNAHLGSEIDFTAAYRLNPRTDVLLGYSHFFTGDYYRTTPGVPTSEDADFVYTQLQINF
jgi:hypothetical protein